MRQMTFEILLNPSVKEKDELRLSRQAQEIYDLLQFGPMWTGDLAAKHTPSHVKVEVSLYDENANHHPMLDNNITIEQFKLLWAELNIQAGTTIGPPPVELRDTLDTIKDQPVPQKLIDDVKELL